MNEGAGLVPVYILTTAARGAGGRCKNAHQESHQNKNNLLYMSSIKDVAHPHSRRGR